MQKSNLYTFGFALTVCICCSVALALASTNLKPAQDLSARLDVVKNILSVAGMAEDEIQKMERQNPAALLDLYNKRFQPLIIDKNNQEVPLAELKSELEGKLGYPKSDLDQKAAFEITKIFDTKLALLASKAGKSKSEYDQKYKLIFLDKPGDTVDAYIIPVEGMGLWNMIYGYMAIQPDLTTVKDVRFYDQQETPGLGGECSKSWFTDRFKNKQFITETGAFKPIAVIKGKVKELYPNPEHQVFYVEGISGGTITGNGITAFLKEDLAAYNDYFATMRLKRDQVSRNADQREKSK
ncbi:MAG: NADH:ubiquinone reductase (Na(+)-transporting) subunit C [Leptospiraceae bacterium]|nr:NADH:ubiquinone reductase (Na(+)-transporting) subunit C [Leptospiraceae bacterium]